MDTIDGLLRRWATRDVRNKSFSTSRCTKNEHKVGYPKAALEREQASRPHAAMM